MEKKTVQVAAALIWQGDRFLLCQRPENKARGLLWEFVGGKVEPGETEQQALIRECREELDIGLEVGELYRKLTHEYPDLRVHLSLYEARILQGPPKLLEHKAMAWVTPEEAMEYPVCPADVEILESLLKDAENR